MTTNGYHPEWDLAALRGADGERLVELMRTGILAETIEVKRDDRAEQTGNFYFELECRKNGIWTPSGINATTAYTWAQVAWPLVIAAPVWVIKRAIADAPKRDQPHGSHPTRGAVIEVGELARRCIWAPALRKRPHD